MKKTMKTGFCGILLLSLLCSGLCFASAAALGDLNEDGKVTAADARLALRAAVGLDTLTEQKKALADVNNDGKVTAADARKILRAAVGLEAFTPVAPATKDEIIHFYQTAVNNIAQNGAAGYSRKEFQTITDLNVTGDPVVDGMLRTVVGNYFEDETEAAAVQYEKGAGAKTHIPAWTLTDNSRVRSASLLQKDGNYEITIVMQDEDTPHKGSSFLSQVGEVMYWEDIDAELKNIALLEKYNDVHVRYQNYTIRAIVSPEGRLILMEQRAEIVLTIGFAKISIVTLENKTAAMENTIRFSDFRY